VVEIVNRRYGVLVGELDQNKYGEIRAVLRNRIPRHVNIDVVRKRGKEKIQIFSRQPGVVEEAIRKILRKE